MGISRSAYYDAPPVAPDDTAIVEAMSAIRDAFERYGWRRMQAALRQQGLVVNHKKVKRLMREHDLQPRMRRRYVATTDSDHDHPIFRNLPRTGSSTAPISSGSSTSRTSLSRRASFSTSWCSVEEMAALRSGS